MDEVNDLAKSINSLEAKFDNFYKELMEGNEETGRLSFVKHTRDEINSIKREMEDWKQSKIDPERVAIINRVFDILSSWSFLLGLIFPLALFLIGVFQGIVAFLEYLKTG